jgi:hypothetical protein
MVSKSDDITSAGSVESFEPVDISTPAGRRAQEIRLLKTQPNSLRGHVMDLAALDGQPLPKMEFTVEGWVARYAAALMAGIGGGGKSTLGMQMCASATLGIPWLGLPTMKANSLAFLTEDPPAVCHIRAAKIAQSLGVSLSDLKGFLPVPMVREDTAMARFDRNNGEAQITHIYHELRGLCAEREVGFVVLDALHGIFDGNENDRTHARRFCAMLTDLATEIAGSVVLLAHPSKSSGQDPKNPTSGSTSWHAGVRSVIHVSDPEDLNPDARTIRLAKANYGRVGEKIEVTWRDGVFHADAEPTGIFKGLRKDKAERVMLSGLQKAVALGYEPSPSDRARELYAPKLVAANGWAEGLKVTDLAPAMSRMVAAGELRLVKIGPPSKQRTLVVPKESADAIERDGVVAVKKIGTAKGGNDA